MSYPSRAVVQTLEQRCLLSVNITSPGTPTQTRPAVSSAVSLGSGVLFDLTLNDRSQFWFGDGTPKGTKVFEQGSQPGYFIAAQDHAFFGSLQRTDGTIAGTGPVKAFDTQIDGEAYAGGLLYFIVPDASDGNQSDLWRTNGTESGTIPLGITLTGSSEFGVVGNRLYFLNLRPSGARLLGVSDGSAAGTYFIRSLPTDPVASLTFDQSASYKILAAGNQAVVFGFRNAFFDSRSAVAIWTSDGKAADTRLIFDSDFKRQGLYIQDPSVAGPDVYFKAEGEVLRVDPAKGTTTEILPNTTHPATESASVAVGDTLYFVHPSPTTGSDDEAVYAIDSTSITPRVVHDFAQDNGRNILGLFDAGGQMYVSVFNSNGDTQTYDALAADGTIREVFNSQTEPASDHIVDFWGTPAAPVVLSSKQELVIFSDGIHVIGPKGEIDHWNPAIPTAKLSAITHVAGEQSDIQFKLTFSNPFLDGLTINRLTLIGPNEETLQPKLLSITGAGTEASPEIARFHVVGPGGNWGADDVGKYRLIIPKDAITTDSGAFPPGEIGTLSLVPADGKTATISGSVFNDISLGGVRDSNEHGLPGYTVFLDSNQNGLLDAGETSAQSDANGNFIFANLAGGDYRVSVVPKRGEIFSTTNSIVVSAEPGLTTGASFGVYAGAELHGSVTLATSTHLSEYRVFDDVNDNGKLDSGEAHAAITNGSYQFSGLSVGIHHIRLATPSDVAVVPPGFADVKIRLGRQANAYFSTATAVTISGRCVVNGKPVVGAILFSEVNGNQTLDAGEPSVVSDASGDYTLTATMGAKLNIEPIRGMRTVSDFPMTLSQSQALDIAFTTAPTLQLMLFSDANGNGRKDEGEMTLGTRITGMLHGENYVAKHKSFFDLPAAGDYKLSDISSDFTGPITTRTPVVLHLKHGQQAVAYIGLGPL